MTQLLLNAQPHRLLIPHMLSLTVTAPAIRSLFWAVEYSLALAHTGFLPTFGLSVHPMSASFRPSSISSSSQLRGMTAHKHVNSSSADSAIYSCC